MTSAIRAVLVCLGSITHAAAAAVLIGLALPMAGPGRAAWRIRVRESCQVCTVALSARPLRPQVCLLSGAPPPRLPRNTKRCLCQRRTCGMEQRTRCASG